MAPAAPPRASGGNITQKQEPLLGVGGKKP